jgi:hypothetical protein
MKMKGCSITASTYFENTIKIPFSRLRTMIKKGDIIRGWSGIVRASASYIEYRVTHVDWWGVYAVPTENMLKKLCFKPEMLATYKRHFKFKHWFTY